MGNRKETSASGLHIETVVVGAFEVNCYLVSGDDRTALVIDPGGDPDRIAELLDERGWKVAAYLLTHGHIDHISALDTLLPKRPAPVAIHTADAEWAFSPRNSMPPYYSAPALSPSDLHRLAADQIWTGAGLSTRILATPGHSEGCVCFHVESADALFCGDTLFAGSVGRTDLPGGNPRTLAASLKRLSTLPPRTTLYPGHGPPSTLDHEARTNYFMREWQSP